MKTVEELIHVLNKMPVGKKPVILDGDGVLWSIKTPYVQIDADYNEVIFLEVSKELD